MNKRKEYWDKNYYDYWKKRVDEANQRDEKSSRITPCDIKTTDDLVYFDCIELLDINKNDKVLEVGVGFGRSVPYIAEKSASLYGIDISDAMIEATIGNFGDLDNVFFSVQEAEKTDFQDSQFDKIICFAVFDALFQEDALTEFNRVIKKGGLLLLTGKNDNYFDDDELAYMAEKNARFKGHPNYFTDVKLLLAQLDKYGFSLESLHCYLRRGDFAENKYQTAVPENFYEYLLLLKKQSGVTGKPKCSSKFSKPFLKKEKNPQK